MTSQRLSRHLNVLRELAILQLAALSYQVCNLSLSPVYGSISASEVYLRWSLIPTVWLTVWSSLPSLIDINEWLPVLGFLAPITQSTLFNYSGLFGPQWGPYLSHAFTCFPIVVLSMSNSAVFSRNSPIRLHYDDRVDLGRRLKVAMKGIILLMIAQASTALMMGLHKTAEFFLDVLSSMEGIVSSRFGMQLLVTALWTSLARSKTIFTLGLLSMGYPVFIIPHLPTAHNLAAANSILSKSNHSLVARQESLTGYISVLDNLEQGFRVMRCDHSLLGGQWINKPAGHPAIFNEPVYSIFVTLEAVRLVETEITRSYVENADIEKHALVM